MSVAVCLPWRKATCLVESILSGGRDLWPSRRPAIAEIMPVKRRRDPDNDAGEVRLGAWERERQRGGAAAFAGGALEEMPANAFSRKCESEEEGVTLYLFLCLNDRLNSARG